MNKAYYQEQYRVLHRGKPWFGTGMEESLEPLAEEDFHRPLGHRTIAQLIGHIVAWRKDVVLRLRDLPREKIELDSPRDWPDYSEKSKQEMLAELRETKDELIEALAAFDYSKLNEKVKPDYYYRYHHIIDGAVQHDVYHLGQINLLKSLLHLQPH